MRQTVTLTEICEALGVADTSARRYLKTFKPFFPVVSEGFPVRYRPEAVEIMGVIVAAMRERLSHAEIEAALTRAGHARDVEKSPPPVFTTTPLPEIIDEKVVGMVAKSVAESLAAGQREALDVNRQILAALNRQNELLENLARAGGALPGESPSISLQEAPGGPVSLTALMEPAMFTPNGATLGGDSGVRTHRKVRCFPPHRQRGF